MLQLDHGHITMVIFMASIKMISAGEFKAKCLKLMDEVNQSRQPIVITKHNKPVARLVPIAESAPDAFGCMKNTVKIQGNIIDPIEVTWDAADA